MTGEQLNKSLSMWQKRMLWSLQRASQKEQAMTLNELVTRMAGGLCRTAVWKELSPLIAVGIVKVLPYRLRQGLHIDTQGRLWDQVGDYTEREAADGQE